MKFKEYERTEYKTNTLFEVVFQARFPQIIKISSEAPSEFQDIIRKAGYPETKLDTPNLPPDMPEEIRKAIGANKVYCFMSEKGDWQVSLADNFISLACLNSYKNYTDFKKKLKTVLETFCRIYEPSYFNRIGFRYRNLINKIVLPIDDNVNIRDFIPEHIAPELQENIKENVNSFDKTTQFVDIDKNSVANVKHAFAKVSGVFGRTQINKELSYIIDIDCFTEHKIHKVADAITKCDEFNGNVRNIFRWSITDELHTTMGPKE